MARKSKRAVALARRSAVGIKKLKDAERKYQSLQSRTAKARAKIDELTNAILTAGVSAGTGFGMGYWQGRTGAPPTVVGIPADAVVAVGAHVVSVLGLGDTATAMLRAAGNGALVSFAMREGAEMGNAAKVKAETPATTKGWEIDDDLDDDDDDDDDEVEGMALEPEDFAGIEIM